MAKRFNRQPPQAIVQWRDLEPILQEVERQSNFTVQGATLHDSPSGRSISVPKPQATTSAASPTPGGTPLSVASVFGSQDTDTLSSSQTAGKFVSLTVVTDAWYDPSTQKLQARTRTIVLAGVQSVSAESDPILIDQAVACTGSA